MFQKGKHIQSRIGNPAKHPDKVLTRLAYQTTCFKFEEMNFNRT